MRIDVTALGEILIDFSSVSYDPAGYPTLKANPGGAPGNFLSALSHYGLKTALIAKAGADAFGLLLKETLKKEGIETQTVILDPDVFTTLAFVTNDEKGDRSFSFARKPGADTCLKSSEVDLKLIRNSRVFHFGSLSLTNEPAYSATLKALECARDAGCIISYDPNLRVPLWADLSIAKEKILWGLKWADIVKISEEEAMFLFDEGAEAAARIMIKEYGAKLVFVTLADKGAYFNSGQYEGYVTCPKVNCIDTTGAGDIFGGSTLSYILKLNGDLEDLSEADLRAATAFGCAAASKSCEKVGGLGAAPSISEIEQIMREDN